MDTRFALIILIASRLLLSSLADTYRGVQFVGFTNFQSFKVETNADELILLSPEIRPKVNWTQLIPSWNYTSTNALRLEAQVVFSDHQTKWYTFGDWSPASNAFARQSIKNQQDADGDVLTDTLQTKKSGGIARLRLTLRGTHTSEGLQLLGLCFSEKSDAVTPLPHNEQAWARTLRVPERSQSDYPEGVSAWCSPTAVSMMLAFWSRKLNRPELDYDVRAVARAVDDPAWPGTGNWAFNVAFAGQHSGLRAYVTRLTDISELEAWLAQAVPVALSVSFPLLRGENKPDSGHLVVCIGFTETGDAVVNDPGRRQVHQIYKRANLIRAWQHSQNTVYLIYPADHRPPIDRFGHWLAP